MMTRAKFSQILRWLLAAALLYWAISRGQIDWAVLANLFKNPLLFIALCATLYGQILSNIYRWTLLLRSQGIRVPFLTAVKLGMSAQFFQVLGPGTLGSDLAKGVYIARLAPDRKVAGFSTVLMDRILGFFGMLFLGAMSFLISMKHLESSTHKLMPGLLSLGFALCLCAAAIIMGLLALPFLVRFFAFMRRRSLFERVQRIATVRHLMEVIELYSERRNVLWYGIFLSTLMHVLGVGVLYLLTVELFGGIGDLAVSEFFLGASVGVTVMALPLAPSGIGVGQVAFASIFWTLGWPTQAMGGSLVTAFQILSIVVNLSGFFFVSTGTKNVSPSKA